MGNEIELNPAEETIDLLAPDPDTDGDEKVITEIEAGNLVNEGEKEEEEEKEEEKIELNEDEEELEPERELITPSRKKEILAKYPQLFKDFPDLEVSKYRDKQFSEIFPLVEDAKEAYDKAQTLDKFQSDILEGNTEAILSSVKKDDPDAFAQIVDNYLPTLAKVDQNAYNHLMANIARNTVRALWQGANQYRDEEKQNQLKAAAVVLHEYVFGNTQLQENQKFAKPENSDKSELEKERENFKKEKFQAAADDITTKTYNLIHTTIANNIDPKGVMSEFTRKNAIRTVHEELENVLQNNAQFQSFKDKLWAKAAEANYSRDSMQRIQSAYLSQAKALLGKILAKTRSDALKGMGRTNKAETDRKGLLPVGGSSSKTPQSKPEKAPEKKMRTIDFLNMD